MAESKSKSTKGDGPDGNDPLGQDVGYIGRKVDPRDNSEHSLESGPDSPGAYDVGLDELDNRKAALEDSNK